MAADYFKDHIRVNAICPSAIDTPMLSTAFSRRAKSAEEVEQVVAQTKKMFRRGHMGLTTPEEIARSYLFLASEQLSAKVTGHILLADNGFSMMRW